MSPSATMSFRQQKRSKACTSLCFVGVNEHAHDLPPPSYQSRPRGVTKGSGVKWNPDVATVTYCLLSGERQGGRR